MPSTRPWPLSILGDEADAEPDGVLRVADSLHGRPLIVIWPQMFADAEDHLHDFGPPRADEAEEAEYLALVQVEVDVAHACAVNARPLQR